MLLRDPEKNERVEARLRTEPVIWLTTVRPDGQPQSTPVWFLWDGDRRVLIYSQPGKRKLANIAANPRVSLHFNDHDGSDIVSFEAEATIATGHSPAHLVPGYVEKYLDLIRDLGMEPEPFATAYSVPVDARITIARAPF